MEVGRRIRQLRGGQSQEDFALRLSTNAGQLSRYERGRVPDPTMLVRISTTTGVTVDWILTGKDAEAVPVGEHQVLAFRRRATDHGPIAQALEILARLFTGVDAARAQRLVAHLQSLEQLLDSAGSRRRERKKSAG